MVDRKSAFDAALDAGEMRYLLLVGAVAVCYFFGSQLWQFIQAQPAR